MAHKRKPREKKPKLTVLAPPHEPQPFDEIMFIKQVGDWAGKNFTIHAPDWGMLEETGEAARAVLKHMQKIRGFDKYEVFIDKFSDALGDIMVYLAHWCFLHKAFFKFARNDIKREAVLSERTIIVHLLQAISTAFSFDELEGALIEPAQMGVYALTAQRVCNGVEYWAAVYDLNLPLVVAATWAKVSKRDWVANPEGPSAELA